MKEKFEIKAKNWTSLVYQIVLLIIIIFNIIFWPFKAWMHVREVEAKIALMQKEYEAKFAEHKDKMAELAPIEIMNIKLGQIAADISGLKSSMVRCQEADEEFRNKFYEFLGEMKKGP